MDIYCPNVRSELRVANDRGRCDSPLTADGGSSHERIALNLSTAVTVIPVIGLESRGEWLLPDAAARKGKGDPFACDPAPRPAAARSPLTRPIGGGRDPLPDAACFALRCALGCEGSSIESANWSTDVGKQVFELSSDGDSQSESVTSS
jgi:hypothetical protein